MGSISFTPLTETTFYILLSLYQGPRHGYAIIKDSAVLSDFRLEMSTGTLYGALKRLLEQGWIERIDDPEPNPTDRERKAYVLTDKGRRILDGELVRLRGMLQAAERQEGANLA